MIFLISLLWFSDHNFIRKDKRASFFASVIIRKHDFNLDTNNTLFKENMSNGCVNIMLLWLSRRNKIPVHILHDLGSLLSQFSRNFDSVFTERLAITLALTWRCLHFLNTLCLHLFFYSMFSLGQMRIRGCFTLYYKFLLETFYFFTRPNIPYGENIRFSLCACFQWFLSDGRSPLLVDQSNSNSVDRGYPYFNPPIIIDLS